MGLQETIDKAEEEVTKAGIGAIDPSLTLAVVNAKEAMRNHLLSIKNAEAVVVRLGISFTVTFTIDSLTSLQILNV